MEDYIFSRPGMFDPEPEAPVMVANTPIFSIPRSEKKYPNFLAWWMEVGRLNPTDPQGWSSISGPWVRRGRVDLITPEEWAALPEEERQRIKAWAKTIPIGCFYD